MHSFSSEFVHEQELQEQHKEISEALQGKTHLEEQLRGEHHINQQQISRNEEMKNELEMVQEELQHAHQSNIITKLTFHSVWYAHE